MNLYRIVFERPNGTQETVYAFAETTVDPVKSMRETHPNIRIVNSHKLRRSTLIYGAQFEMEIHT